MYLKNGLTTYGTSVSKLIHCYFLGYHDLKINPDIKASVIRPQQYTWVVCLVLCWSSDHRAS